MRVCYWHAPGLSFWAAERPSAPAPFTRVVIAVDGIAQPRNLPVLLSERLGYFRAEALVVTLVDAPGSPSPAELSCAAESILSAI